MNQPDGVASLNVLHLVGSAVSEFYADLSRLYAADCLAATADPDRYAVHIAYVSPDGLWRFPDGLDAPSREAAAPMSVSSAIADITAMAIDVVVPQMFCLPGMTFYRGLFDVLGIPYVGNAPEVMALGAHKARAKAVVSAAGVRVPAGEVVTTGQTVSLSPPVVVKPVEADNSLGIGLVRDPAEYPSVLAEAFRHGDSVLVETYVELGREVRCGILVRDGELVCLPLEEYLVDSETKPIRVHDDKIAVAESGDLRLVAKNTPAAWIVDRDDPVTDRVWAAARKCHVALGCRDYSLFDFRIDPAGEPWFLEAGLYCSFARSSVISVMAAADGLTVPDLFQVAVGNALGRRRVDAG